jgi:hypothetical protein
MSMLRDKFFWANYGKFVAAGAVSCAVLIAALGVPPNVAVGLMVGAIIGFPAAYEMGRSRPSLGHIQARPTTG